MAVDNLLTRHRNLTVLVLVLFLQVMGLAVQVKRTNESGSTRLMRLWAVSALTPVEKGVVHTQEWVRNVWGDYFALRKVRQENQALKEENQRLRLEAVRLAEDANQARRIQALLGFKEQFIQETLPAQVISTTGSDFSRGIYIDKGSRDGVKVDMPVITPDGVVGKVYRTYPTSSLVLEINDPSSGAGVILEKSRLQGIVKGNAGGETLVHNIMSDEKVEVGEKVLTSGGDRIFPKGMPVGVVSSVGPGPDLFLSVRVKPAANLNRVEEVLVITKVVEKLPDTQDLGPRQRAADILAERLPSVPPKPPEGTPASGAKPAAGAQTSAPGTKPPTPAQPASGQVTAPKKPATVPVTPAAPAAGQTKVAPKTPPPGVAVPAAANTTKPSAASGTAQKPSAAKPDATKPTTPPTKDAPRQ